MPFLTRDVPPGGRHIDRAVPPAVPVAPAAARVRQLLPVGLLVAASSAGVALSPMLGGGTSALADANHGPASAGLRAVPVTTSGSAADVDVAAGEAAHLDRAAYVVSRDAARAGGKHRALGPDEHALAPATTSYAPSGKHRALGTAVETAPVTQQAPPKHAAATPAPVTKTSTTSGARPAGTVSEPAPEPSPVPSGSATAQPDVLTATVTGVLGTVTTLLGGS